jgi:DNA-binding MltR family transcriptional regulator
VIPLLHQPGPLGQIIIIVAILLMLGWSIYTLGGW